MESWSESDSSSSDGETKKRNRTRRRRKPMKRKMMGMPTTSCLICFNASTPTSSDWVKVGGHYDPEYSCLNSHLSTIFVLRNCLDYPKEECQKLLQKMGDVDPEEWFRLCASCSKLVQQCMETFQQSPQSQEDILSIRAEAHETLRSSFRKEDLIRKARMVDSEDEDGMCARTQVRKYFRGFLLLENEKRQNDLTKVPKVCPVCNYQPDNPRFMKEHLTWCKNDPSQYSAPLRREQESSKKDSKKDPYFQCFKCPFIGKDDNARYMHLKKHKLDDNVIALESGKFSCVVCHGVFDHQRKIHLHLRSSHGEELGLEVYHCSYCGRFFNSQNRLTEHTNAKHTGRFRHKCDQCPFGCMELRDMKKHKAVNHPPVEEDTGHPVM